MFSKLRFPSLAAVFSAALVAEVVAGRSCEGPGEAIQWFNYGVQPPLECVARLREQATSFCVDYFEEIYTSTVYLSTVTPTATSVTVSSTSTSITTSLIELTSSTLTTDVVTPTVTEISSSTTVIFVPLAGRGNINERRPSRPQPVCALNPNSCINLAVDCLDLTEPNLRRRNRYSLEAYCECLEIPIVTITAAATTAPLATSTSTDLSVEVSLVSETTFVSTLTSVITLTSPTTTTTTTISTSTSTLLT